MDTLAELLSSRVKAELLRLLFGVTASELHLRELARRAGLNEATVRQEAKRLSGLGLILVRRDGNRSYYHANQGHPLYPDLRGLVVKTSGLADALRQALGTEGIHVAFVFGSIAAGSQTAGSDVDLMVIGSRTLRQLAPQTARLAQQLGREVNPHTLTPEEFAARLRSADHFLTTVLASPKVFVIGGEDELEELGGERLVAASSKQPAGNRGPPLDRRPRPRRRR